MEFVQILFKLLISNCLLLRTGVMGAPPNIIFNQNDEDGSDSTGNNVIQFTEPTSTPVAVADSFFPKEVESESDAGIKAPEGIVPAPVAGATDGRTFHHLVQLHQKVDYKVNQFLSKLLSPWFAHPYPGDAHQFPYYDDGRQGDFYRQDVVATKPKSAVHKMFQDLTRVPQYFVNHPINFKQTFGHGQHSIGKRSVEEEQGSREGKTLYKVIPQFEERVGLLMRRVFGDLYGSNYNGGAYKSSLGSSLPNQNQRLPMVTTLANMISRELFKLLNSIKSN